MAVEIFLRTWACKFPESLAQNGLDFPQNTPEGHKFIPIACGVIGLQSR